MSFEDIKKPRKKRSDALWEKIWPVVQKYAGKKSREVIADSIGMTAGALSFHCSKHNVSLRLPGRQLEGIRRSTVKRKKERERHAELEGPVTLSIDVETLWRPITKTKLPITVRQHYYA